MLTCGANMGEWDFVVVVRVVLVFVNFVEVLGGENDFAFVAFETVTEKKNV